MPKNQNFQEKRSKIRSSLPYRPKFSQKKYHRSKEIQFQRVKEPNSTKGSYFFFCKKRESGPFKKTIAWHFEHYKMITSKRKQTNYNKIYCKLIFYKNISLSLQTLYFIQIQRFSNKKLQISKASIHFQQTKKVLYFTQ